MPESLNSPAVKYGGLVVLLLILGAIIYSIIKIGFSRTLAIFFMSLSALFTLMGGAGTTCVALNPTGFEGKFAGIAPFQWLWILFVVVGVAAGIMGIRSVVMLVKGSKHAYRDAVIVLVVGVISNAIHVVASRALRGGSMPVDGVLYVNVLTLIIFLIYRMPGIWNKINLEKPTGGDKTGKQAAAISMLACGFLFLTIQYFMAPTHTISGVNYADVWHTSMTIIGALLITTGISLGVFTFLPERASTRAIPERA